MDLHQACAIDLSDVLVVECPLIVGVIQLGNTTSGQDCVHVGLQRFYDVVQVGRLNDMSDTDGVEVDRDRAAEDAG